MGLRLHVGTWNPMLTSPNLTYHGGYIIWSTLSNLIITNAFLVSINDYKLCLTPLKHRWPIKKIGLNFYYTTLKKEISLYEALYLVNWFETVFSRLNFTLLYSLGIEVIRFWKHGDIETSCHQLYILMEDLVTAGLSFDVIGLLSTIQYYIERWRMIQKLLVLVNQPQSQNGQKARSTEGNCDSLF